MKIYSKKAFKQSQEIAKEAVALGSENDAQFEWHCAMILLAVAYGHHKMQHNDFKWSAYYESDEG
ncbi:hypothetical protein HYL88_004771 [Salmonella enterica subsp. enterica serovar Infantis]|uniref:hypothetical protein n=1 Tax=Salmonella enterica TaxID=28901 RepID=UPI0019095CD6|nr:hypothetical protein [Salmonella enterica]EFR5314021.1 hypothetical protein [Salmonella enterica subsp. enterica serovar Typhimurium]EFR5223056.1 hypothetical protein [Salmonella enterica subsp. enterica serovar Infantis]EFR5271505.1 hypothetical protein [Salmonella enterica subsp. enterica serovar Infantis]EFR5276665.1 hypothetical protein [Salmonella enterica subsp. enterica serovar Infantis]EFR5336133.1 hypothetical protein [Salmonella enterica subsp. enterica serovar Infantis]